MFFWNVIKVIAILSVLDIAYGQLPPGSGYDIHCLPAKMFTHGKEMGHIDFGGEKQALLSMLHFEAFRGYCSGNLIPSLTFPVGEVKQEEVKPAEIDMVTVPNIIEDGPIRGWPAPIREQKELPSVSMDPPKWRNININTLGG